MIDKSKVIRTYSGKIGCMCGCLGNYAYPSNVTPEYEWDRVSDRSVTLAVNKINRQVDWTGDDKAFYQEGFLDKSEHIYFLEKDGRNTVVYTSEKCH